MNELPEDEPTELDGLKDIADGLSKTDDLPPVEPTLSAYFGPEPVGAPAFIKAVRAKKISRFSEDDVREAAGRMPTADADGKRLLGLVHQSKLPDPIDRWIWPVVQERLKATLPDGFDPLAEAPEIFRLLARRLGERLDAPNKDFRVRAEADLMLAVAWLTRKRSLDPWTAIEHLRNSCFGDEAAAGKIVRKIVGRARLNELQEATAVASFTQGLVRSARMNQEADRRRLALVQSELEASRTASADLRSRLEQVEREKADVTARLVEAERRLVGSQQHHDFDLSGVKAQQNVVLRERLAPLLSDAIDALEIVPVEPEIALIRIKSATRVIEEASQ